MAEVFLNVLVGFFVLVAIAGVVIYLLRKTIWPPSGSAPNGPPQRMHQKKPTGFTPHGPPHRAPQKKPVLAPRPPKGPATGCWNCPCNDTQECQSKGQNCCDDGLYDKGTPLTCIPKFSNNWPKGVRERTNYCRSCGSKGHYGCPTRHNQTKGAKGYNDCCWWACGFNLQLDSSNKCAPLQTFHA